MIRTISSEWIKISTVLAHKILVIAAVAFPVVIITLASTFGDVASGPDSVEMAEFVLGVCVVSAMLLGVVAVIGLTSEYTHNTIRPTYAATPRRSRVIVSKWLVSSLVTVAVAVFAVFGAWFLGSTIYNSRGGDTSIGDEAVATVLVSTVVLAVLVTWFGFGLGLIIRNSPATVSILLLWPLLIEGLLRVVFGLIGWDGVSDWLPYQAAIEASGANVGDESLGRPMGQILFGVVGLAVIAVGTFLDHHRDA